MYRVPLDGNQLFGSTEVHDAAHNNHISKLLDLIADGFIVNCADNDLVRPLHEACFQGHTECVKILLENGAEVNARNIDGATPLCDAASSGHVDIVELLLQYGAHVNPPLLLTSPLHEAAIRDKWKTVQVLVNAGADLNANDCHFGTPLHVTAFQGNFKSAVILLRAGAAVNAIKSHNTCLHDASRRQDCDFIKLLLSFGADVHARNNNGQRPVDLVPSSTNPAKQLLHCWDCNVRDLKHICRLKVRQHLGSLRLKYISTLPLPKLLNIYLEYRDVYEIND